MASRRATDASLRHEPGWRPAPALCDLSGEDTIVMPKPFSCCSPHVAAVTTLAIAVLGAAVVTLDPATATQDAALASLTLRPSCITPSPANGETTRTPAAAHARARAPEVSAAHDAPPT